MPLANEAVELGNDLIAIPLPHQRGWRIEKKGDIFNTPPPLRSTYWSLSEAREAVRRFNLGVLKFNSNNHGISEINKGHGRFNPRHNKGS